MLAWQDITGFPNIILVMDVSVVFLHLVILSTEFVGHLWARLSLTKEN